MKFLKFLAIYGGPFAILALLFFLFAVVTFHLRQTRPKLDAFMEKVADALYPSERVRAVVGFILALLLFIGFFVFGSYDE